MAQEKLKLYSTPDITAPIGSNQPQPLKIYQTPEIERPQQMQEESQYTDDPSWLQSFSNSWINQPLSRIPTYLTDIVAEPMMQFGEGGNEWYRTPALYGGAFLHNIGEQVSGMTSPTNLAVGALTGTASALSRGNVFGGLTTSGGIHRSQLLQPRIPFTPSPVAAERLMKAARLTSYPMTVAGAGHTAEALGEGDVPGVLSGLFETGLGALGTRMKVPGPTIRSAPYDVPLPPTPPSQNVPRPPSNLFDVPRDYPSMFDVPRAGQQAPWERPPQAQQLPGMNIADFEAKIPEPSVPPSRGGVPLDSGTPIEQRARAFAGIEADTQRQIFALQVEQSEAVRMGDHARATAIEQAILNLRVEESVAKRNWQPPQARQYADITGEESLLPFRPGEDDPGRLGPPIARMPEPPPPVIPPQLPPDVPPPSSGSGGGGVTIEGDIATVRRPDQVVLADLRRQGFEPWPGHFTTEGGKNYPQWRRTSAATPPPATQSTSGPILPKDLQGAAPRYQDYELDFESDLDKALYIIAKEKPSKRDADYVQFVISHLGGSESQVRGVGKELRRMIGAHVKDQPKGRVRIPKIADTTPKAPKAPVKIRSGEPFTIPKEDVTPALMRQLKEQGVELVGRDKDGNGLFKLIEDDTEPHFEARDPNAPGGPFGRVAPFRRPRQQSIPGQTADQLIGMEDLILAQQAEREGRSFAEVKAEFEATVARKEAEQRGDSTSIPKRVADQQEGNRIINETDPQQALRNYTYWRNVADSAPTIAEHKSAFVMSEIARQRMEELDIQGPRSQSPDRPGDEWGPYDMTWEEADQAKKNIMYHEGHRYDDPQDFERSVEEAMKESGPGTIDVFPQEKGLNIVPFRQQNVLGRGEGPTDVRFEGTPTVEDLAPRGTEASKGELRDPIAQQWDARMRELDARNAPDLAYRDIMSTAGKNPLKRGDTWRQRVQRGIEYFESKVEPRDEPSFARVKPPGAERIGGFTARVQALKLEIDAAYRVGDTKRVIALSQDLEEMMRPPLGEGRVEQRAPRDRSNDEPLFARIEGGGYKASMNVRRGVENITKDYTSPLSGIQIREGIQNHLDAADKLGSGGNVKVRLNSVNNVIEIYDNGGGMDDATLGDKLFEAFSTGKEGEEGATGGKGIGSASYIYGGRKFEIETVAVDLHDVVDEDGNIIRKADGKKYRITTSGTPEQFITGKSETFYRDPVKMSVPTGTTIKISLKDEHDISDAKTMLDNILDNSRNRPSRLVVDRYNSSHGTPLKDIEPDGADIVEHRFAASKDDKLIGDFTTVNRNSEVKVLIPKYNPLESRTSIELHYLNNGMYQFSEVMSLHKMADDIPDRILIDIHPLVDDQNELYPFINTREDIKRDIREEVTKFVKDNIASPGIEKRKNRVQELYDSMSPVPVGGTTRKPIIYDPGNRFTPHEMEFLVKNPTVQRLIKTYDEVINNIVQVVGRQKWIDRLEGVGLVFDPNMHGVHIPNPTTNKSTILINPFLRIESGLDPKSAAWKNTITNLHEVGHIGSEHGEPIKLSPTDLADPRLGEFLSAYMNQLVEHGDVGLWTNTGHGMDFAHRLGEVYAKFGVDATFKTADTLHGIFTGGAKSGSYSPEIQRLLQLYTESRGRAATTEDLLSGTGVKSADRGFNTEGNIPGDSTANRGGTSGKELKVRLNDPTGGGGGEFTIGDVPPKKKDSWLKQAYNLPRGLTTTLDLSAPLRQGLPMIFTKHWWTSWKQMISALGSEGAYQKSLADLKSRDLFQGDVVDGKVTKSWAQRAGMKLMDVGETMSGREENVSSTWVEKALPGARASNRAYTAFLNQLRADSFENLLKNAFNDFEAGTKGARNPYTDLAFAKEIADFVNTATGRGPLRTALPSIEGGRLHLKEKSLEKNAELLTNTLFSPRLMASRVRMMNPMTYAMADPFVRKQYLKAFLSVGFAWGGIAALAKGAGAEVNSDPTSADFWKIKIGNTRLDPAGGFQQHFVALAKFISGHTTSSNTGRDFELGQGYRAETRLDIAQRFGINKLHPVAKFAVDMANASANQPFQVGDRTLQMFVPLIIQDAWELAKEDQSLLPLLGPVGLGMGTQTYEAGEAISKFIPKKSDPWVFKGGSWYPGDRR